MTTRRRLFGAIFTTCAMIAGFAVTAGNSAEATDFRNIYNPDSGIEITNAVNHKCLDIRTQDGVNNDRARVQQYHCTGVDEQKFIVTFATNDQGHPYFYLVTLRNKCIELSQPTAADGVQIDQTTCALKPEQLWRLQTSTDLTYNLISNFGTCLDVSGGSSADEARIQSWTCNGTGAQRWRGGTGFPHACSDRFNDGGPSTVSCEYDHIRWEVRSGNTTDQCLDVTDASHNPDVLIQQWGCSGANEQLFLFSFAWASGAGNIYYQIKSNESGLCLEPRGTSAGAPIRQERCGIPTTDLAQSWRVEHDRINRGFLLVNAATDMCLTVPGESHSNGTKIQQANCNNFFGQSWTLRE